MTEAQWITGKHGYVPATVTRPMYNLPTRGIEQEYLPMCRCFGIFTCIYNPLAGGLLTGKQQKPSPIAGSRFEKNQMYRDRYWHLAYFDAVDMPAAAAAEYGRSLVRVALCWVYFHSASDCPIPGASRQERREQNPAAIEDGPLPDSLPATCDTVWFTLRGVTPKYNR